MNTEEQVIDEETITKVQETVSQLEGYSLYETSVHEDESNMLCIARKGIDKYLLVISEDGNAPITEFKGGEVKAGNSTVCDVIYLTRTQKYSALNSILQTPF